MSITVVNSAEAAGTAAHNSLAITTPTAGNLLVCFASFIGVGAATFTDAGGSGSWTTSPTMSTYNTSTNSLQVGFKSAYGNETSVTTSNGGTSEGIAVFELQGTAGRLDNVVGANNTTASLTSLATPALTTTNAAAMVLGCIGTATGTGAVSAWTGTPVLTNITASTTRALAGSALPAATLSSAQFTAHWANSVTGAMSIVVTVVPSGGGAILF